MAHGSGEPCACFECANKRKGKGKGKSKGKGKDAGAGAGAGAEEADERARVADHAGLWMARADTAYVPVVACARSSQFVTKNAEYAVAHPDTQLELQSVALLDMSSVAGPHWDPTQRTQRIL